MLSFNNLTSRYFVSGPMTSWVRSRLWQGSFPGCAWTLTRQLAISVSKINNWAPSFISVQMKRATEIKRSKVSNKITWSQANRSFRRLGYFVENKLGFHKPKSTKWSVMLTAQSLLNLLVPIWGRRSRIFTFYFTNLLVKCRGSFFKSLGLMKLLVDDNWLENHSIHWIQWIRGFM